MRGQGCPIWRHDPRTDICFVYTLAGNMLQTLQAGYFPRSATAMEKVADHYGIPSIHLGLEVARLEKAGKLIFKGDKPKTDADRAAVADKILFSPDAVHTVRITIHPEQPNKAQILSQRGEKIDDPKRFDGTTWYAGALLMIGEPVE